MMYLSKRLTVCIFLRMFYITHKCKMHNAVQRFASYWRELASSESLGTFFLEAWKNCKYYDNIWMNDLIITIKIGQQSTNLYLFQNKYNVILDPWRRQRTFHSINHWIPSLPQSRVLIAKYVFTKTLVPQPF